MHGQYEARQTTSPTSYPRAVHAAASASAAEQTTVRAPTSSIAIPTVIDEHCMHALRLAKSRMQSATGRHDVMPPTSPSTIGSDAGYEWTNTIHHFSDSTHHHHHQQQQQQQQRRGRRRQRLNLRPRLLPHGCDVHRTVTKIRLKIDARKSPRTRTRPRSHYSCHWNALRYNDGMDACESNTTWAIIR